MGNLFHDVSTALHFSTLDNFCFATLRLGHGIVACIKFLACFHLTIVWLLMTNREVFIIPATHGIHQTPATELGNGRADGNDGHNVAIPMPPVENQATAISRGRISRQVTFGTVSSQELPSISSWTTDGVFVSSMYWKNFRLHIFDGNTVYAEISKTILQPWRFWATSAKFFYISKA